MLKTYKTAPTSPKRIGRWYHAHNIEGAVRQICGRRVVAILDAGYTQFLTNGRSGRIYEVWDRQGNLVAKIEEWQF